MEPKKMQHLLIKLAAAAIVAVAFGSGQAQAGPLPALNDLTNQTSQATPVEKAGNYRYRYGGYPYNRPYRPYPYWYYRPRYYGYGYRPYSRYYGYGYRPYYWRYGYWNRPYYRHRW
ncbi:MAG TPA: hypothetical protein VFI85_04860 [Methyloceanibacter sp.]|nr:hypothetical protein [Methyloceanibacter sp.]